MKRTQIVVISIILTIIFSGTFVFSSVEDAEETGVTTESSESDAAMAAEEMDQATMDTSVNDDDMVLKVPLGDITLAAPEGVNTKRLPVEFPHSVHFDFQCQKCHHKWEGDADLKTCTAGGCHDSIERTKKSEMTAADPDAGIRYFKEAFHQRCINCHKTMQQQNLELEMSMKTIEGKLPKVGPTGCVQCHPKDE